MWNPDHSSTITICFNESKGFFLVEIKIKVPLPTKNSTHEYKEKSKWLFLWKVLVYQIIHFFSGFMRVFSGHLNVFANSGELDSVWVTRILWGQWGSFNTSCINDCFVVVSHQVWKYKIKLY